MELFAIQDFPEMEGWCEVGLGWAAVQGEGHHIVLIILINSKQGVAIICFDQNYTSKHRVATPCFNCPTKMSPIVKVASKTIKN